MLLAATVLAWQAVSGIDTGTRVVPAPVEVGAALWEWLRAGTLLADLVASVARVVFAFLGATLVGVGLALALALARTVRMQVLPLVEVLRPIPPIAWIPLAIVWFGIGDTAAVFIGMLGAFFPIFTSALAGLNAVSPLQINTARCLGAGYRMIITDVLLPGALPQIVVGVRTGLGVAWMSLIAAELVGAQSGLGYMIQTNRILLRTDHVVAGMAMIGLTGLTLTRLIERVGERLTPWEERDPPAA